MTTWINPFDWQNIFVSTLAGSWNIFIFLMIIVVSFLAGRFRLPDKIFLMFLVLFGILMAPYIGLLYLLMLLIVGLTVYYGLSKVVKQ